MTQAVPTTDTPAQRVHPDFTHVSTVMLYDIARHTASVLFSALLNREDAAEDELERAQWAARRRLLDEQIAALNPDDRVGIIAQNEAWDDERRGLHHRR